MIECADRPSTWHAASADTHGTQKTSWVAYTPTRCCFVFRFDDAGEIAYLTEHWNTWQAHRVLMNNYEVQPARP